LGDIADVLCTIESIATASSLPRGDGDSKFFTATHQKLPVTIDQFDFLSLTVLFLSLKRQFAPVK